jgi:hypothetical protein
MKKKITTACLGAILCILLIIPSTPVSSAPDGATVQFTFDPASNQLFVTINSRVGVGGGDIKLDIPSDVNISTHQASGFMDGAMYLSLDTIHRWFQISANGQTQGSLTVAIIPPADTSSYVTLAEVNLLDAAENIIPIETSLPLTVNAGYTSPGSGPGPGPIVEPGVFAVLSPNGGEVLEALRPFTINWTVLDKVTRIDLSVSVDGGKHWREIARKQANTGSYKWRVPNMNLNNCIIRLDAYNADGEKLTDTSDTPFSVQRRPGGGFGCE